MATELQEKILGLQELPSRLEALRAEQKTIVLCHGVFDLVHVGHIRHLRAARRHGDVLVVTLTADKHVKRGPGRPVFTEQLRAETLASLGIVDFVAIADSATAIEAIRAVQPNFYVKGSDYRNREQDVTGMIFEEEEAIKEVGGQIAFTDDIVFSSSQLINQHFDTYPEETGRYLRDFSQRYTAEHILAELARMKNLRVLVIGDTIIDQYHYCRPLGKSSKESIVVQKYLSEELFAGGALATANHLAQLSDNVELVSVLGDQEDYSDFICSRLNPTIKPTFFRRPDCVTTVKRRYVSEGENRKLFEVCYLDDHPLCEKQEDDIIYGCLRDRMKNYDLVVVADFGHGMLTRNVRDYLCNEAPSLALNVQTNSANLGFNLVTKYSRANFVCIDEQELRFATQDRYSELPELVKHVHGKLNPEHIFVTRGPVGSISYSEQNGFQNTPALATQSIDKVGAGDAFFAFASPCFQIGMSAEAIGFIGNAAGALAVQIVCNREPVKLVDLQKFIVRLLRV